LIAFLVSFLNVHTNRFCARSYLSAVDKRW